MSKGMIHLYTGDGKGKTTAALGLILRAYGSEFRPCVFQFLKGQDTGELVPLVRLSIPCFRTDEIKKFISQMNDREFEICKEANHTLFDKAKQSVYENRYDIILLDEIIPCIRLNLLHTEEVIELINLCKGKTELILTGRDSPPAITDLCDYVSSIAKVKHPYDNGLPARKGIEY